MNKTSAQRNLESLTIIAHRLEAFNDRGKQDFLSSHDLEDIIAVIDGRPEIITDISKTQDDLRLYLTTAFSSLLNNAQFIQALPGHLNYSSETEERKKIVEERIQKIITA